MSAEKVLLIWLYHVHKQPLPLPLLREIALYLTPCFYLLGTTATTLTLYLLPGSYSQTFTCSCDFSDGMRHCWINSSEALMVGGGNYLQRNRFGLKSVYKFQVQWLVVSYYPCMREPRYSPGVICVDGTVYVFGGYHYKGLETGEKVFVSLKTWIQLPKMTYSRHSFSPVYHAGKIYLLDISKGFRPLEAFIPTENTYETMPVACEYTSAHSCAFLLHEQLVVLSCYNFAWSWTIGSQQSERVKVQSGVTVLSSCPPVVTGGCVWWVEFNSGMLSFMRLNALQ